MSDINANIVIAPIDLNVTVSTNQLSFTPEPISLNIYAAGVGLPGGATTQIQYNAGGILGGTSNLTYSGGVTTISNVTISSYANLGAVGNVHITGGSANYALITDGAGNLSWGQVANANTAVYANYANYAGNAFSVAGANVTGQVNYAAVANSVAGANVTGQVNYAAVANSVAAANITGTIANANYAAYAGNVTIAGQSNITSLGTLTGLTTTGIANFISASNVALGNVANVHITGGTNGQYLQTDGAGNIAWVTGGGSGNGVVGGSNTQIQFNNAGAFGGNAGFTFDNTTGNVAIPNNLSVTSNIAVANISATGNISAGNVTAPVVLPYGIEKLNLITAQTGTYNFDIISNAIRYTTSNASANLTLNFRGNSTVSANVLLANGQSVTGTYVFKTGSTPYGITALQVDTSVQTIKWASNVIPSQVANTLMSYVFTIVKTSTTPTYDVLGSATRYG